MNFVKALLWKLVQIFFAIYFRIVGKPTIPPTLEKVLSLYENDDFFELFSLIRAWDAPYKEVNAAVPQSGLIYDLGCGDGTQTNYLALSSSKRRLIGVELNKTRVSEADKGIKNASFQTGSILKQNYKKADGFVLTHVLHHLPTKDDQEKLLKQLQKSLKKNGKIVIIEISRTPFLKYVFTWLTDAFIVPILFEKKLYDFSFNYRTDDQWTSLFDELGLKYKVRRPHKGMPFSHIMFVCTLRNIKNV